MHTAVSPGCWCEKMSVVLVLWDRVLFRFSTADEVSKCIKATRNFQLSMLRI